jgi:CRP/FNR family cyclic AMP-dependent transcriptional regulator
MTTLAGKMMLERSPLFRGLPPASLQRLASLATQRRYSAGEVVFSQGDPGDALYGVVSGKIRISTGATDGREVSLNIMEPGDTFGEIALLDGGERTAAATADVPSELVSIRREHFLDMLKREPPLALELLRLCGQRLRWTSGLFEDAALLDVPSRLAKRLVGLVQDGDSISISQEELAGFLGVSRQVVNQYLQGWKDQGWIKLGRGVITVCDKGALQKLKS